MGKKVNIGIGFATGRKNFKKVLKSYICNWIESGLNDTEEIGLNLFVAYDLQYSGALKSDFTSLNPEIRKVVDSVVFIGPEQLDSYYKFFTGNAGISEREAKIIFNSGYATQRNMILWSAMNAGMDYLLFLDDDEYPMAVTKNEKVALWSGQHVLETHLSYIGENDITCGYHCGYISPIPYLEFNDKMPEEVFREFITALSNDIINWNTVRKNMRNGGVTYADADILMAQEAVPIPEIKGSKFISGSDLCINLRKKERVFPFYNPPGARGEDTFLGTCLSERNVTRVPCYTFHDGFSQYSHILSGTLPTKLAFITPQSAAVRRRFYNACVGWVRYKPLFIYITDRLHYETRIEDIKKQLDFVLPYVCDYFGMRSFMNIKKELSLYAENAETNFNDFQDIQRIWKEMTGS